MPQRTTPRVRRACSVRFLGTGTGETTVPGGLKPMKTDPPRAEKIRGKVYSGKSGAAKLNWGYGPPGPGVRFIKGQGSGRVGPGLLVIKGRAPARSPGHQVPGSRRAGPGLLVIKGRAPGARGQGLQAMRAWRGSSRPRGLFRRCGALPPPAPPRSRVGIPARIAAILSRSPPSRLEPPWLA